MIGAELLVKCLEAQDVDYIFGIPGAKVDSVFNALLDSKIKLILCRHEQNAVFMAQAYGRVTGKPGMVLVTSGPGVTNLTTGMLTATTEGDPVIAIGGNVSREMLLRGSHQSADNVRIMEAVTKKSISIEVANSIPEVVVNAFKVALSPRSGAYFISIPQDVLLEQCDEKPLSKLRPVSYGVAQSSHIEAAAKIINQATCAVLFLGAEASRPENTLAIRELLKKTPLATVVTYQGAGVISKDLLHCFVGRVGLFKNQPGDMILDSADLVVTIGYNTVEYDPEIWNSNNNKKIIHIDYHPSYIHSRYESTFELLGDISTNINALAALLDKPAMPKAIEECRKLLVDEINSGKNLEGAAIHPLRFIYELTQVLDDEMTICCDIGSVYMWLARYFLSYRPHQLLFSNGQQTLGVGMPWAMGCYYARLGKKVISISGDGGFLFSAMELETAVREKMSFVHFIWTDGSYNMVKEQEEMKYHRKSGVDLGSINIPEYAKAFGAIGLELKDPDQFKEVFQQAINARKPVLIDVSIDYSHNTTLFNAVASE